MWLEHKESDKNRIRHQSAILDSHTPRGRQRGQVRQATAVLNAAKPREDFPVRDEPFLGKIATIMANYGANGVNRCKTISSHILPPTSKVFPNSVPCAHSIFIQTPKQRSAFRTALAVCTLPENWGIGRWNRTWMK